MNTTRTRLWNWARDELILALDLYLRIHPLPSSSKHPEVIELSQTLRGLPLFPVDQRPENFRNPTGVYFKLLNFHYIHTNGAAGYSNYGAADEQIWREFAGDRERLHAAAAAVPDEDPDDADAPEGRVLLRLHRMRERSPVLVRERKRRALQQHGVLQCEACGFDFRAVYDEIGDGFIECHHTVPVSTLAPGQRTKLSDLALVCANCHRMLHRGGEVLTITRLQSVILSSA